MADKKFYNYNELLKKAQKKRSDYMKAEAEITGRKFDIESCIETKPSKQLALLEHYKKMPNVEIDSGIEEFWKTQDSAIKKLDVTRSQNEYLNAYSQLQDKIERMDEERRNSLGLNSISNQERTAHEQISDAKKRVHEARKKVRETKKQVDPFQEMLGIIVPGVNQEHQKIKDAEHSLKDAKRGLRDAKKRLAQVQEAKARLQQVQDKLKVDEKMVLDKMADAKAKILSNRATAYEIDEQSKKIADRYKKSFELVDKYNAIQAFKKNMDKNSTLNELIKTQNPVLYAKLMALPSDPPKLVITLNGELQLPDNSNELTAIDSKIDGLKQKLPDMISTDNIPTTIELLTIKESDTVGSIQTAMDAIADKTSNEYKQLEMKKNHLELVDKVKTAKTDIETLRQSIINNPSPSQKALRDLQTKQARLKILEEELKKDPYSQTMSMLADLQKLNEEKEKLGTEQSLDDISSLHGDLEASKIKAPGAHQTISDAYKLILEAYNNKRIAIEERKEQPLFPERSGYSR